MATKQSFNVMNQSFQNALGMILQALNRRNQLGQIDQARQGATSQRSFPVPGGPSGPAGNVSYVPGPGGQPELDRAKFLQSLLQMVGNPEAERQIGIQSAFLPKMQSFGPGQTVGPVDPITNKFSPQFQTPFAPQRDYYGAPTQLQKHQDELAAIRAANPNDPRIPQYEAVIEKLQIGVPGYRFIEGPGGELIVADPKRGKVEGGTGRFTETPEAVNMQIRSLADIGESARNIKGVLSRGTTGPVAGRARKVGTLFFDDKDQQSLINYLGQLRPIIYGLSGKQINEAEQTWLDREILPKLEQPDENFGTTLNIFNEWVDRKLKSMKEQYPGAIIPSSAPRESDGSGFQEFTVNGKKYRIPDAEVPEFKKDFGIQ